jgi:histidyl-tRNA synthetase
MSLKYPLPRGTRDILPEEMPYWHHVEDTARSIFSAYNYQEIRTPIFELTDLFERGIGDGTDIVEKEMYTFTDKGDRRLTLRPEGTAPIARAYLQNNLGKKEPQSKLYYCGPMFRYERPQAGRYRQFYQIGVENIGNEHPFADAELISMGVHLFDEMGISGLSVSLNSVGCLVCRPVIEERLKQFLGSNLKYMCEDCNRRFSLNPLRILDCKNPTCKTYRTAIPDIHKSLCHGCSDHFSSVVEYIEALGIPFQINPQLVRGLDYYTRTAFEIVSDQLGAQNALCGGGRYDGLIHHLGGQHTPAVGFAFGVDRAVMILKELSDILKAKNNLIYVAPIGAPQQQKCFYLVDHLRRAGLKVEIDYSKDDIKYQLKQANKLGAAHCILYGDREAENDTVVIKNMQTGNQNTVSFSEIISYLNTHANTLPHTS